MRTSASALVGLGALLGGIAGSVATREARAAEPFPARAERLFAPGRNAASEDSGHALVLNPANLAHLPSWEARAQHLRCPDDAKRVGCGWAFDVSTPLFWDLATGFRFDFIQPPWGSPGEGVGFPFRGYDYAWLTWGLAGKVTEHISFGVSLQSAHSTNPYVNGLFGITAGVTYRPVSRIALAAVAHDFNGPSTQPVGTAPPVLDRSYTLSAAFRPTGRRNVEVGMDVKYYEGTKAWMPRVTAGVDVPGVGRVRADGEVANLGDNAKRSFVGTAGLEINFGHAQASGGAVFGNGLGSSTTIGQFGSFAITGYRSPGVPRSQRAVYLRIENTPGTRGHTALLRKLWKIAEDKEIAAVTLVLRAEPASSLARAEELADALRVLRAHGKKSVCSWEDNAAVSLYVCANADRTVVNPAGGLRYSGLKSQYMYLAGLLSKIGVKAEFVRIGAHKTAPEQFMNEHGSDVARADHEDMLRNREAVFVKNVAQGRKLSEERVRAETAKGPYVASEARSAGFVDGYAFDDELDRVTQEVVGSAISYVKYDADTYAPDTFGARGRVGLLYLDGDIVDGRSETIPLLDTKLVGSYSFAESVRALRDDSSVRAVVLRIDSPGGSSMASDVMWRELVKLGEKKPLIVSMGSVAASGGYYVAMASRMIFALPLTVTGSIGIFYGKADVSELLGKLGVNVETYKTTPRADAESFYRGFTADERVELVRKVNQFYDVFLDRVSRARSMTKQEVDAVGQGRVWTGQQAMQAHLVDRMGGLRHALEAARSAADLPADAPILEVPSIEPTLLERALKLVGFGRGSIPTMSIEAIPPQFRDVARAIAPMAIYEGDVPLARMEWVPVESSPGKGP